jgi:hypothetical protein
METLETMSFAEIAAFATVAAAASYLLGLVALGWPLYKHITRDAATTQYALSLISKTEIAGYGLRVYAGYPLISAIVSFLFLLLFVTAPRVTLILSWVICLLLILWIFFPRHTESFLRKLLPTKVVQLYTSFNAQQRRTTPSLAFLFNIPSFVGVGVAYLGVMVHWWNTIWVFLATATLGAYICGLLHGLSGRPTLPSVEITGQSTIVGKLLTHSGGFWYLFDHQGALIAIPDSSTDSVRVYGRARLEHPGVSEDFELQQTEKTRQAWDRYLRRYRKVARVYFILVGIAFIVVFVALFLLSVLGVV